MIAAKDRTGSGDVDSLVKLIDALDALGIEVINTGAQSHGGGRGVRLKDDRGAPAAGSAKPPEPGQATVRVRCPWM